MAPPKKPHPNAKRLSKPEVAERIRKVIGSKVKKQDVPDVMQSVYLRLSMMLDRLPEGDEELLSLVGLVTHGRVVDYIRNGIVHEGRLDEVEDLGELPVEDSYVSQETRADWGKMLDLAEQEIDKGNIPPDVLRWARGLAEGKTIAEMAAEENVSESKIKMALKRARDFLGPRWKEISSVGGTIIVALLVLLFLPRRGPAPEIHRDSDDMGAPTAPSSSASSEPDAAPLTPDAYRAKARDACAVHDWDGCAEALNRAAEQDIDSEKRPDVIALRKAIDKAARDSVRKQ